VDELEHLEEPARPTPLRELLDGLDRAQLRDLVLHLAEVHPDLVKEVVNQAALLRAPAASEPEAAAEGPAPHLSTAELRSVRRQVSATLRSLGHMRPSEAYWHVGSVVGGVREVLEQAKELVARGDGNNAIGVLEAITDEYMEGWLNLDDSDGYASDFFAELGSVWVDAALTADLSLEQRQQWAAKLTTWVERVADYGIDDVLDAAQAAFLHGWDYPPLQRILEGAETPLGSWEEPPPWYAKELTAARLKALDRQGRHQAYLHLARAAGQMEAYVTMLARVGRTDEAAEIGLRQLVTAEEALALAQALLERGDLEAAIRVAEHGLTLDEYKGRLATWLCDLAWNAGRGQLALRAALVGFHAAPSLDAYLRAREISAARWPEVQPTLLAFLRQARSYSSAQVDVFMHEGLLDDAISAVDKGGGYGDIERVMDAVLEYNPEWVIQAALKQAARIIEPGQAKYYHHAVDWLARARDAYEAAGREAEWKDYLRDLRDRHGRKHKLMGMIARL
jgi:uncharacterized Zn finger protein